MKKGAFCKLLAASVLACAASVSQAAVVDVWDYTIDMSWDTGKTVFSKSTDPTSATWKTNTVLSWGSNAGGFNSKANQYVGDGIIWNMPAYARSSLIITKPQGAGKINTGGDVELVNMFVHTNNAIYSSLSSLKETVLNVSVDLKANGVPVQNFNDNFQIYFYETPNTGKNNCLWGSCDDDLFAFVVVPEIYKEFTHDGMLYQFNYFQTSGPGAIKQLDAAVCNAINSALTTSCYGFQTKEAAQTAMMFGFSITAVPEPETYAMLLAGLGMVGVVVRRRRSMLHT